MWDFTVPFIQTDLGANTPQELLLYNPDIFIKMNFCFAFCQKLIGYVCSLSKNGNSL